MNTNEPIRVHESCNTVSTGLSVRKQFPTWNANVTLRYQGGTSSMPYNMTCGDECGLSLAVEAISWLSDSWKSIVSSPLHDDMSPLQAGATSPLHDNTTEPIR